MESSIDLVRAKCELERVDQQLADLRMIMRRHQESLREAQTVVGEVWREICAAHQRRQQAAQRLSDLESK